MEGEFNQKKRAERLSSSGLSYGHPHAIQEGSSGSANSHRDDSSVESKWISDPSCSHRSRPGIPLSFQEMDEIEGNFGDSDPRSRPTRQWTCRTSSPEHQAAGSSCAIHGAKADTNMWALAARYMNETLATQRLGRSVGFPQFLAPVQCRKRYWKTKSLGLTVETVQY